MATNGSPAKFQDVVPQSGKLEMGIIGLGRMGGNMLTRLAQRGHRIVGYARTAETVQKAVNDGGVGATSVEDLVSKLSAPRTVWVMVPSGKVTDDNINLLSTLLEPGDLVIDGGNSNWKDSKRHAQELKTKDIHFMDAGTSGGIWGLEVGYSLMVGGEREDFERVEPIFRDLAPENGYGLMGPAGAGHFVKMVHNGIEYGLMQAYAEGFDIMRNATSQDLPEEHRYQFDMADIAELWRRGSVVGSWLLDLTAMALTEDAELTRFTGTVQDSGEGRWTIMAAIEEAVPCDVLSASLYTRFRSRQDHTFAEKMLSGMRNKFGGHVERAAGG